MHAEAPRAAERESVVQRGADEAHGAPNAMGSVTPYRRGPPNASWRCNGPTPAKPYGSCMWQPAGAPTRFGSGGGTRLLRHVAACPARSKRYRHQGGVPVQPQVFICSLPLASRHAAAAAAATSLGGPGAVGAPLQCSNSLQIFARAAWQPLEASGAAWRSPKTLQPAAMRMRSGCWRSSNPSTPTATGTWRCRKCRRVVPCRLSRRPGDAPNSAQRAHKPDGTRAALPPATALEPPPRRPRRRRSLCLQAALQQLGLPSGARFVSDLYSQYDHDRSQSIDFAEFKRWGGGGRLAAGGCMPRLPSPRRCPHPTSTSNRVPAAPLKPFEGTCRTRSDASGRPFGASTPTATASWTWPKCTAPPAVRRAGRAC